MPDASPGQRGADCNLLYGMLALQMNFVSRDGVLAAMQAWVFDKARPLGQVLQEQGQLTPERRQALDQLLAAQLQAHDGDAHKSLAAVALPGTLRDDLRGLDDADVQASLAAATDPDATRPYAPPSAADGGRYLILRPHARGGLGEVSVILYNTFGPGDSFVSGVGYVVSGSNSVAPQYTATANEFTPSQTATLDQVRVAVGLISGTGVADVLLTSNGAGGPDGTIEVLGTITPTRPDSIFTLNSAGHPLLTAGTPYWYRPPARPSHFNPVRAVGLLQSVWVRPGCAA
jgi:hypothetical protein